MHSPIKRGNRLENCTAPRSSILKLAATSKTSSSSSCSKLFRSRDLFSKRVACHFQHTLQQWEAQPYFGAHFLPSCAPIHIAALHGNCEKCIEAVAQVTRERMYSGNGICLCNNTTLNSARNTCTAGAVFLEFFCLHDVCYILCSPI